MIRSQSLSNNHRNWKTQILLNSQESSNSQTKGDSNWWKQEELIASCLLANPMCKLSMTSMVRNICIGRLGLAVWLCSFPSPAHLLISWISDTGKSPWFHSNNWKHQYYPHSSPTKSKTQQILGGKFILSQLKPGQYI